MASIEHRVRDSGETWRVVWRQEINGVRRKQQMSFPTAEQAERFRKLVEGSGKGNEWPAGWAPTPIGPGAALTFGQWATEAIERRTRANERTKADYRRDLKAHFATLLDVPLAELDAGHVARWVAAKRAAAPPLAEKTIRNLYGFASSVYADALTTHPPKATHNPFAAGLERRAGIRVEEMCFLTPQEFALVLGFVREEYRPLIRFLAGTGLRFGEATALTVGDVSLLGDRRTVTVNKAWKRLGPSEWTVGEPKTPRSRRTNGLSDEMVDLLIPLVASRKSHELLFCGVRGLRLPHIEVYKRGWAPAVARANVCATHYAPQRNKRGLPPLMPAACDCPGVLGKKPRIHDLRHSWVSWLLEGGLSIEVVSRLAGHSSTAITDQRYAHLRPGTRDAEVAAVIDRALGSPERVAGVLKR